jgi:hypothetical protein
VNTNNNGNLELDNESQLWLEGDMGEDLPDYDWGTEEIPEVKPIEYKAGVGFIVVGGKNGKDNH